ncbi:MAG: hypothetical protein RIR00_2025 [Pseudomonadota bacterium]|jgi:HPt (histidine-containing phosphotransfer) domain-containing protein
MAGNTRFYLGKYREIVLAVAFFLVFDLAVLILNFVISFQISEDAVAINLAGRQRMLSQRMSKSVFDLLNEPRQDSLRELGDTTALFEKTLSAFEAGGITAGGSGSPVTLPAVRSDAGRAALATARASWEAVRPALAELLAGGLDEDKRRAAAGLIRQHNPILLKEMNLLTSALEAEAGAKANRLRLIQTGGIVLALGNFLFILLKFIRRLRASDAATEAAQQETREILGTVREGLVLVDKAFRLGSQQSRSFGDVLGLPVAAGDSLLDLLSRLVDGPTLNAAREYLELLLAGRVKESLVEDLNPLAHVSVLAGNRGKRHLSFKFNRVVSGNELSHLLVTVLDISEQVRLEEALQDAQRNAEKDIDLLLKIAAAQPEALHHYLGFAENELLLINDQLRDLGRRRDTRAINHIFRRVHALKGEAAALDLPFFVSLAHAVEEPLSRLRREDISAEAAESELLAIPVALEAFLQRISQVHILTRNLRRYDKANAHLPDLPEALRTLSLGVAQRQGKTARLQLELAPLATLPERLQAPIREISQQLLRNALVHGIEAPELRLAGGKDAIGQVQISLNQDGEDWVLRCRDDGNGIDPEKIRRDLLQKSVLPADEVTAMSHRQLVQTLFLPGVSTADGSDEDAGRGVGLDLVRHEIGKHGGQMRLQSRPGHFTEFIVRFEV